MESRTNVFSEVVISPTMVTGKYEVYNRLSDVTFVTTVRLSREDLSVTRSTLPLRGVDRRFSGTCVKSAKKEPKVLF